MHFEQDKEKIITNKHKQVKKEKKNKLNIFWKLNEKFQQSVYCYNNQQQKKMEKILM